ncbi:MAG: uroporphyrinogen-III C-methyltransferase [Hyphomicrobiales bacterium]|nr:MAG: uroporphyrinogen-III C-methyltransferase [Hyphomicrobiales bacterium]
MGTGKVFLVGAGPGDPGLLTVRARDLIAAAEVVVYDRLVSEEVLAHIPTGASLINVGKAAGFHPIPQHEINETLLNLALAGRDVVRLKGGDPLIFARGGEEAAFLARAGVEVEIIPGITAAQGGAASLGIPLTQRGVTRNLRYITGQCRSEDDIASYDWPSLADPDSTLCIYMGAATIARFAGRLMAAGRSPSTPVAAIAQATRPGQVSLTTTLEKLASDMGQSGLSAPVMFIIGEVVHFAAIHPDIAHDQISSPVVAAAE